jgi:hypothetical protein
MTAVGSPDEVPSVVAPAAVVVAVVALADAFAVEADDAPQAAVERAATRMKPRARSGKRFMGKLIQMLPQQAPSGVSPTDTADPERRLRQRVRSGGSEFDGRR